MSGLVYTQLQRQLQLLLPGGHGWTAYHDADTRAYWQAWRRQTPRSTRLALAGSVLLLAAWIALHSRPPAEALAAALHSRWFAIRQAAAMLKSVGCLAYFSDPEVLAINSNPEVTSP